jgi:DNA-binding MarR family transcriptional regulator
VYDIQKGGEMTDGVEGANAKLLREAEEVAANVHALRRLLLRSFEPDIDKGGVTVPQMNALEELAKEDALNLKELSGRMGLSHSTVSGIVDRLERKGFVGRTPDPEDRRYSRIFLSEKVRDYVRDTVPSRRLGPILKVLELASAGEREQILAGIGTLRRLLEAVVSAESKSQRAKTVTSG